MATGSGIWNQIEGKWKQVMGSVRAKWGDLTDDDLEEIAGNRDKLVGKIQERYGMAQADINRQIDEWEREQQF